MSGFIFYIIVKDPPSIVVLAIAAMPSAVFYAAYRGAAYGFP